MSIGTSAHFRAERSRKRDLLTMWGINALGRGAEYEWVCRERKRLMRKPLGDIERFVALEWREPPSVTRVDARGIDVQGDGR